MNPHELRFIIFILIVLLLLICILLPSDAEENYIIYTKQKCYEIGFPVDIAIAIGTVESNWKNIEGETGDIGIFQLNPKYISYYEKMFWHKKTKFNPWNPYHNIEIGIQYLKWLYNRYNSWELAIKAYNIGPTHITNNVKKVEGDRYFVKVVDAVSNL